MASGRTRTRRLVIATVAVLGLIGSEFDRAVVATPAWQRLGVADWAAFSRHADLGNGLVVYPIVGILPTLLAVAAAISHRLDRDRRRSAGVPIQLTALFMLGVMATTAVAAPIMLGVDDLHDTASLRHAFETFTLWGVYVRGAFFAAAFVAGLWAVATEADADGVTTATPQAR
jgi:hypothetical protein